MFSRNEYAQRIKNAQAKLGDFDAILVSKDKNLRYFTGVDSGRVVIWKGGAKYWLNEVYFDRAKNSSIKPLKPSKECVKKFIFSKGFKRIGMDPVTLHEYNAIELKLRKLLKPTELCEDLRKIKSKEEIKMLTKAGKIASDAMRAAEESHLIGLTEIELAAAIECEIRRNGSEGPPFSQGMLCLSGPNTKYPHAPSTTRRIKEGDLLILDLGAIYEGYHSDMTRTLMAGDVSEKKFNLVAFMDTLKEKAIEKVELGMKIADIHKYIEDEIEKKGHKFAHLSGHGVGLEIHEKPSVGPSETDVFMDGMVFTIEPGVYTTQYGARSEDTIALVDGKKKILT